jgi:hypothetical protein
MRLGLRIYIERFMGMVRALGVARPQEPPTEPIEREVQASELPEPPPLHEQHHTSPTEHQGPHGTRQ